LSSVREGILLVGPGVIGGRERRIGRRKIGGPDGFRKLLSPIQVVQRPIW
jgi:hypothetical protein